MYSMTGKGLLLLFIFIVVVLAFVVLFSAKVSTSPVVYRKVSFVDPSIEPIKRKLETVTLPPEMRERINATKTKDELQEVLSDYHNRNKGLFEIRKCEKQGVGVFATQDIPAYTIIGRYPGYPVDPAHKFSVVPKYILVRFNPADDDNKIYHEFQGAITPFLNEPSAHESPNCSWFQEENPYIEEGRYSIITTRPIKKGEECTINYGPVYHRDYPYSKRSYSVAKNPLHVNQYDVIFYDENGNTQIQDSITYDQVRI